MEKLKRKIEYAPVVVYTLPKKEIDKIFQNIKPLKRGGKNGK